MKKKLWLVAESFLAIFLPTFRGRVFFQTARSHARLGQWRDAAACYERGLTLCPKFFGAWVQLGHAQKELGNLVKAERAYLSALDLRPSHPDLLVQLGHFYAISRQQAKSVDFYKEAVAQGSTDPIALRLATGQQLDAKLVFDKPFLTLLGVLAQNQGKKNDIFLLSNEKVTFARAILRSIQ